MSTGIEVSEPGHYFRQVEIGGLEGGPDCQIEWTAIVSIRMHAYIGRPPVDLKAMGAAALSRVLRSASDRFKVQPDTDRSSEALDLEIQALQTEVGRVRSEHITVLSQMDALKEDLQKARDEVTHLRKQEAEWVNKWMSDFEMRIRSISAQLASAKEQLESLKTHKGIAVALNVERVAIEHHLTEWAESMDRDGASVRVVEIIRMCARIVRSRMD